MDWITLMNASVANNEMSQLLPAGLSYRSSVDSSNRVAAPRREAGRGFARRLADGIAWLVAMPRRHGELQELAMLSDRELSDIGLNRAELKRVFDPAFAHEHAARGVAGRGFDLNA
jgi:uncharacterized protein YjiS (DUF1127 family)